MNAEQAREQCVEAVARPLSDAYQNGSNPWQDYIHEAEAAVTVLLGTPDTPCPCRCHVIEKGLTHLCECGGSSVVPGQSALRVPCDTCSGTKKVYPSTAFGAKGTLIRPELGQQCPDCSDGFGLAAIDVARGAEPGGKV